MKTTNAKQKAKRLLKIQSMNRRRKHKYRQHINDVKRKQGMSEENIILKLREGEYIA